MKRKIIYDNDVSLKKQKISKKRNRDVDENITDIIPVLKKIKINDENDIQKYLRYRRDILIYT
jgi:hypothetical protein